VAFGGCGPVHAAKLAEYMVFDSEALTVDFARVPYDALATESRAASAGYRLDPWRDRLYDVRRRIAEVATRAR
jgi:hypothetical protein